MVQKKFKKLFNIIMCLIILINVSILLNRNCILDTKHNPIIISEQTKDTISEKIEIEENNNQPQNMSNTLEKKDYIASIIIPKINLNKELYPIGHKDNNVNKNIEILKESTMPNIENSNLILASHSGSSNVAFFNDLKKLKQNDEIYILYNDVKYSYFVYKIFEVVKDGQVVITRNTTDSYLTLITCKVGTNKQFVIICKLKNKEKL